MAHVTFYVYVSPFNVAAEEHNSRIRDVRFEKYTARVLRFPTYVNASYSCYICSEIKGMKNVIDKMVAKVNANKEFLGDILEPRIHSQFDVFGLESYHCVRV